MASVLGTDLQGSGSTILGNTPIYTGTPQQTAAIAGSLKTSSAVAPPTTPAADATRYSRVAPPTPTPPAAVTPPAPPAPDTTSEYTMVNGSMVRNPNYKPVINPPAATPAPTLPTAETPTGFYGAKDLATSGVSPTQEQDEAEIRRQELAAMQGAIDATNKVYDDRVQTTKEEGEKDLGRTNALSALMGLSGSSSADTRTGASEGRTAKNVANVEAQRAQDLAALYGKVDANVKLALQAKLETDKAAAKSLLDKTAQNAQGIVQSMAQTLKGVTWEKFKETDPTTAARIVDQSGLSDFAVSQLWKQAIPEQYRPVDHVSYKDDGQGGTIMTTVSFDPVTKKVSTQDTPIAAPISTFQGNEAPISVNGMLLQKQPDGTYKNVAPTKPDFQLQTLKSQDAEGNSSERVVVFDKNTGKFVNQPAPAAGAGGAPTQPTTTRKADPAEYNTILDSLPEDKKATFMAIPDSDKNNVMGLINGDVLLSDLAKGGMKGSAAAQRLFSQAKSIDPNFSESVNKARYNFIKNWNDPQQKSFQNRTTINTALGHLAELKGAVASLDNSKLNAYNSFANFIDKEKGNPNVPDFNLILTALSSEMAGLYKGSSPTDPEIQSWHDSIMANYSPATLNKLINRATTLASDRLGSITNEYKNTMGRYPASPLVQSDTLQKLQEAGVDVSGIQKLAAKSVPPTDIKGQAAAAGYDYDAMRAANYTDEQISAAINGAK